MPSFIVIVLVLVLTSLCTGTRAGRAWALTYYHTVRIALRSRGLESDEKARIFNEEARKWADRLQMVFDYEVEVDGELPGGPLLLLCNHQSALDIPVLLASIPADKACSFMPKLEMKKVALP